MSKADHSVGPKAVHLDGHSVAWKAIRRVDLMVVMWAAPLVDQMADCWVGV